MFSLSSVMNTANGMASLVDMQTVFTVVAGEGVSGNAYKVYSSASVGAATSPVSRKLSMDRTYHVWYVTFDSRVLRLCGLVYGRVKGDYMRRHGKVWTCVAVYVCLEKKAIFILDES